MALNCSLSIRFYIRFLIITFLDFDNEWVGFRWLNLNNTEEDHHWMHNGEVLVQ